MRMSSRFVMAFVSVIAAAQAQAWRGVGNGDGDVFSPETLVLACQGSSNPLVERVDLIHDMALGRYVQISEKSRPERPLNGGQLGCEQKGQLLTCESRIGSNPDRVVSVSIDRLGLKSLAKLDDGSTVELGCTDVPTREPVGCGELCGGGL